MLSVHVLRGKGWPWWVGALCCDAMTCCDPLAVCVSISVL